LEHANPTQTPSNFAIHQPILVETIYANHTSHERIPSSGQVPVARQVFSSRNVPTSLPKKGAAARQDWTLGGRLYHDVWEIALKDETLLAFDSALERLLASAEYGVGKTKALITKIEKNQSRFLGRCLSLSRFLAERRKLLT